MAIFRMEVTAIARTTYTVDVDASTEKEAKTIATSREIFNASTPEEFQVDAKNCEFEFDTEKLTTECPECGIEHPIPTKDTERCSCWAFDFKNHLHAEGICIPLPWCYEDEEYCASCGAKIEAAERKVSR
jgi:hypothetical protein